MASSSWTNRIKATLVGVGLGLAVLMSNNWWNIYTHHVPKCPAEKNCVADFVTFYAAAQMIWDDRQALYDLERQQIYQNRIAPVEKVLPFVYPPITAAFLAPLAWFRFSTAFLLLTIVNLLLIGQSLRLLMRHLNSIHRPSALVNVIHICAILPCTAWYFTARPRRLCCYF